METCKSEFYVLKKRKGKILILLLTLSTMAVPPSYSDLGKAAKDIFSKGYGEYDCRPKGELLTVRDW